LARHLLLLLTLVLLVAAASAQSAAPEAEQEILRLVNAERQSRGLAMLVFDEHLQQAARKHSALMAASGEVEHVVGGESKLSLRLGGLRFDACGENVALSAAASLAHTALMHSPGHRANILDAQYNALGVGVIRTSKGIYVTEDFAHRLPEVSVDEAETQMATNLNRMRRSVGMPILNRVSAPELRGRACEMAANDRVNPHAGMLSRRVSNSVAFTALDLTQVSESLGRLQWQQASGFSVGACYRSSASYENPVFWIIVVTYF